ncbi:hypothetical protein PIB30_071199 [Stylosanthes scabra]|uniref:Uncharacterized protein n=1 Tax=Stylosanthes scabra TaxID=79078 RepID=A0ABU6SPR9_9FABA|nr:hypothetical protein [Stylosanthes scabra]
MTATSPTSMPLGQLGDELMSSFAGKDVLRRERYSSASTRTRRMYFNPSRNGGGWTCKATPTLKSERENTYEFQ